MPSTVRGNLTLRWRCRHGPYWLLPKAEAGTTIAGRSGVNRASSLGSPRLQTRSRRRRSCARPTGRSVSTTVGSEPVTPTRPPIPDGRHTLVCPVNGRTAWDQLKIASKIWRAFRAQGMEARRVPDLPGLDRSIDHGLAGPYLSSPVPVPVPVVVAGVCVRWLLRGALLLIDPETLMTVIDKQTREERRRAQREGVEPLKPLAHSMISTR